MVDIDMTVDFPQLKLTFKNPLIPGSSEICTDSRNVGKCIKYGVGGVILKSATDLEMLRIRAAPGYCFPTRLGPDYATCFQYLSPMWGLLGGEKFFKKELPEISKQCKEAEIPLIGSIESSSDFDGNAKIARDMAPYVDAIELDMHCPVGFYPLLMKEFEKKGVVFSARMCMNPDMAASFTKTIKDESGLPVFPKQTNYAEPLEYTYEKILRVAKPDGFTFTGQFGSGLMIDVENEIHYGSSLPHGGSCGIIGNRLLGLGRLVRIIKYLPQAYELHLSGSGGVWNAEHALQWMLAGCQTVQLCSLIYARGPIAFKEVLEDLTGWMEQKGYSSPKEFRGKALKTIGDLPPDLKTVVDGWPEEYKCKILLDKCNFCKGEDFPLCEELCLWDAIKVDKDAKKIDYEDEECRRCGGCISICPEDAIVMVDEKDEIIWDNYGQAKNLRTQNPILK